jgi:signal transduction histidine kinase
MKYRPWLGAAAGAALGLFDYTGMRLLGIQMDLAGHEVTFAVMALYSATFAALGYAIGRLAEARERVRADAETIRAQYEALRASQARTLQAEKLASLGRMAAGVAHEVRNPLGVIRSSAALIQEGTSEEERAQVGRFIVEEVDRLDSFVRAILDFSRPLAPSLEAVDAAGAAARAAALAGAALEGLDVSLEVAPLELSADPDLLVGLLAGLLVNAGEAAKGKVAVRGGSGDSAAWIEVADDGPGVAAADRGRLFEPFFTTKAKGTGLGLAMAARVVEAHGGRLEVMEGRGLGVGGGGACLRVCLPGGGGHG